MATSITKFEDAFDYKIINEPTCTNAAIVNATSESGSIFSISIDNSLSQSDSYFKFFDSNVVSMGSTAADMVLKVKAASKSVFEMPKGLPFTYLSFACTANPNPTDNTAPGGNLVVNIVAS